MSTRIPAHPLLRRTSAVAAILLFLTAVSVGPAAGAFAGAAPVALSTAFPVHAEFRPSDPFYIDQWGLPKIGAQQAWDVTLGSRNVVVAVVDTGVVWTDKDLEPNIWSNSDGTHGYNFVDQNTNPMDIDPSGLFHGTGVAGVIAAVTDNTTLIAGTAQVRLMAVRALGSNGQGSSLNVSQAIRWAADHGAKIINLSLGTNETFGGPTDIQLAVNYAWSRGALIVAAAGNSATASLDYPARLPNVVSVAAIDETGNRASFSNYGTGLDLSAPGDRILTLDGTNGVHYLRGTSFAAPFVAGAAALLLSIDNTLTNVELWNILNRTAVQPIGTGYNTNYGWGVVNVWNAINALNQPFISVNGYPTSVSRSSSFDVAWSVLGPAGLTVTDTHLVWGTASGQLGNATPAQTGQTHQTFTASGVTMPSSANALYIKVVATVNGTQYESDEKVVSASPLPSFLFVLYQLLASNLLYLALFILALAAVVAFLPQRRAARARRATYQPWTMYPPNYYVQASRQTTPPPGPPRSPPPIEFVRPATPPAATMAPAVVQPPVAQAIALKKRCPNCGTTVNADNLFCFFCGNPFR